MMVNIAISELVDSERDGTGSGGGVWTRYDDDMEMYYLNTICSQLCYHMLSNFKSEKQKNGSTSILTEL